MRRNIPLVPIFSVRYAWTRCSACCCFGERSEPLLLVVVVVLNFRIDRPVRCPPLCTVGECKAWVDLHNKVIFISDRHCTYNSYTYLSSRVFTMLLVGFNADTTVNRYKNIEHSIVFNEIVLLQFWIISCVFILPIPVFMPCKPLQFFTFPY